MAPINLYWARGNSETYGAASMLRNVTSQLDTDVFDITEVQGLAEVRPAGFHTLQESLKSIYDWMDKNKEPGKPWMGLGYSLGALGMANYVGEKKLSLCKGVGLLADPGRHVNQITGNRKPKGWGIAYQRKVGYEGGYPVWSLSAPNDPISELPGDNGLRNLVPFFELPVPNPLPSRAWDMAYSFEWIAYFTITGRHTCYATEKAPGTGLTYTQSLALMMNTEGRRLVKEGLV